MAELTTKYLDKKFVEFGKLIDHKFALANEQTDQKLDAFAEMVAREFFSIHERIDKVELRLEKIESRLDSHDSHFSLIELELRDIKQKIAYHANQNREDTDTLAKDVLKLHKRITVLESKFEKLKSKSQQSIKVK